MHKTNKSGRTSDAQALYIGCTNTFCKGRRSLYITPFLRCNERRINLVVTSDMYQSGPRRREEEFACQYSWCKDVNDAATTNVPIKPKRVEFVSRMVPRGKNAALRDATCNYARKGGVCKRHCFEGYLIANSTPTLQPNAVTPPATESSQSIL